MTNQAAILACVDPVNAHWQLGPLPPAQGRMLLIGWRLPLPAVDSGVPEVVAAILARALTSVARVSFPVSDDAAIALKGEAAIVKLVSTCEAETAVRMFADPGYPWHLQGQVALLSPLHSRAPKIDRKALLSLLSGHWTKPDGQLRQFHSLGILAVIRPGVDGDIGGVLSLSDGFANTLLEALECAAGNAQFAWFRLPEDDFANMLAKA